MRIGYACQTIGVQDTDFKSCTMKYASEEKLLEVIEHNLKVLDRIIDYNIENRISMFRISSDLIPFGSSPANQLDWGGIFKDRFQNLKHKIALHDIRISMHPGQYTVINSPDQEVVSRAIADLEYHNQVLDLLTESPSCKMILHIGGGYGDKDAAINRFLQVYQRLDSGIKKRLIVENDDRIYHAAEVYRVAESGGIPFVFDVLHHQVNREPDGASPYTWIERAGATWRDVDGTPKIHYSQQNPDKKPGSHSDTIGSREFMDFVSVLKEHIDVDIMMEVKDKNISAVKCQNIIHESPRILALEKEWSLYKYLTLEHSQNHYQQIRQLLKDKDAYPVVEFYELLEDASRQPIELGNAINGIDHVWGYFKSSASEKEKAVFQKELNKFKEGTIGLNAIKRLLYKMALAYDEKYLIHSYYFSKLWD